MEFFALFCNEIFDQVSVKMILEIQGFLTEKNICALMMIMMHLIGISW